MRHERVGLLYISRMKRTLRWTASDHPTYTCPTRCLSGLPFLPRGGISTNVKVVLEGYHSRNTCWISFAVMKPVPMVARS